jgi:hypothetical protein
MRIHAAYWACIAFFALTGMLCRRWPLLSLYGALGAFCAVYQVVLALLPYDPLIVLADTILFVLPSVVLARACGASPHRSLSVGLLVPIAMYADREFGYDIRALLLIVGVSCAQGMSALIGIRDEIRTTESIRGRWAAVVVAAVGVLGIGFVQFWPDVAWTGVAAHAFVCIAYLANEER